MSIEKKVVKNALRNSLATGVYIFIVASFLSQAENLFENAGPNKEPFIAMMMLTLFVTSAAITSFAVFGQPVMWYIDGKKKEAISLVGFTVLFLFLIVLISALALFV